MIDLDELERKAKAATPGEWKHNPNDNHEDHSIYAPTLRTGQRQLVAFVAHGGKSQLNAEFIAALSPSVAQELINRLREAEKDAARYRHIISTGKFSPDGDSGIALSGRLHQWTKAEIDKAVDAAIAKGQGNG